MSRPGQLQHPFVNGTVAWLFAVTGPIAILLAVTVSAGLDQSLISSWIFASHVIGGGLSIAFSLTYRQPIGLAWTIPGAVLLGPALVHFGFAEAVGAFLVTGVLIAVLGITGWARTVMSFVPLPLVMAMVAGIFLPFGLQIIGAFEQAAVLAAVMVGAFLLPSALPALAGVVPPVLAALVGGVAVLAATRPEVLSSGVGFQLAAPVLVVPTLSPAALLELVVPLAITVIAIQNAQGFAILRSAGYDPPEDRLTTACGIGSIVGGVFGAVSTCVTGPVNGILNTSGPVETRWVGGVVFGALFVGFGLLAPTATALALALPAAFIALLGGLALLPVLSGAFVAAFGSPRWRLGSVTTFLVTVSGVTILRVGAAFWGLVLGLAVSWLAERDDVRALLRERRPTSPDRGGA
jgi:benzoate membrane transport protein